MHGVYYENQDSAGNRSQKRPEKRNDIRTSDNHAYQHGIGRAHERRTNEAQDADYYGIQNLPAQETDKRPVGKAEIPYHNIGRILFK